MMKKFIIMLTLLSAACQPADTSQATPDDQVTNLPSAERMTDKGDIGSPSQALDFCAENKEFEKC